MHGLALAEVIASEAVAWALYYRHLKRIVAHILNDRADHDLRLHMWDEPFQRRVVGRGDRWRHLILYGPWIGHYPDGLIDELEELADSGDPELS